MCTAAALSLCLAYAGVQHQQLLLVMHISDQMCGLKYVCVAQLKRELSVNVVMHVTVIF